MTAGISPDFDYLDLKAALLPFDGMLRVEAL